MSRFLLTPAATADLTSIRDYVARDSVTTARRVLREIRQTMRSLASRPGMGHVREELTTDPDLRFWPIYSYLIVYYPEPRPIRIVRVLHGARDVERILRQE